MVLIPFQAKVARLDQFQPLRLVLTSLGELRHAIADYQPRRFQRLALELLVEHVQMVLIHMGIADEIGEPAWGVTGQAAKQRQQCRALGEVERRTESILPPILLNITPDILPSE